MRNRWVWREFVGDISNRLLHVVNPSFLAPAGVGRSFTTVELDQRKRRTLGKHVFDRIPIEVAEKLVLRLLYYRH